MQSERWIFSTKKQDISFAGASPKNYTMPWDLGPSETELPRNEPLAAFVICGSTVATSTSRTQVSLQSLLRCLAPAWTEGEGSDWHIFTAEGVAVPKLSEAVHHYLHEEEFKNIFVSAFSGTYAKVIERLFNEQTSDLPSVRITSLPDLPQEVRTRLMDLRQVSASEEDLYENADEVAEWTANASETEQTALVTYFQEFPSKGACILLSALADAEARLTSEPLLWVIADFLDSEDKRLAQAAAACLLGCGGTLGKTLLLNKMKDPASLPHARLIQGIVDLLVPK